MTEQPKSILIVDDDEDLRRTLVDYVEALGFMAVEASQGETAVHMMDLGYVPTVIISDIRMPIMDGTLFMKIVYERYPEVPFVVLTGSVTPDLTELARSRGVMQILEKPCEMKAIRKAINDVLKRSA